MVKLVEILSYRPVTVKVRLDRFYFGLVTGRFRVRISGDPLNMFVFWLLRRRGFRLILLQLATKLLGLDAQRRNAAEHRKDNDDTEV